MLGSEVARLVRVIGELPCTPASRPRHWPSCSRPSPCTAATCPDGREHLDAAVAAARRPDLVKAVDALHSVLAQAGTEAATRFEQTSGPVMAKGVEDSRLPLGALRRAQRGRWGPGPVRQHRRGVPRGPAAPRGALPGVDDHAVDARHQAQRGRPGAWPCSPSCRPSGPAWSAAGWRGTRWPTGRWPTWSGRTWSARGRCRASGERLRREGRPRGGDVDDVDGAGRGVRGPAARPGRRRVRRSGDDRGDRRVRHADRPVRLVELAVAEAAAADDARRPDVYQGTELWDFSLVDPTTAVRWTTRCAARCSPGWTAVRCRPSTRPGPRSCSSSPGRCGRGGTTPSGSPGTSRSR